MSLESSLGKCHWEIPFGNALEKRPWEIPLEFALGNAIGKCPWEILLRNTLEKYSWFMPLEMPLRNALGKCNVNSLGNVLEKTTREPVRELFFLNSTIFYLEYIYAFTGLYSS